MARSYDQSAQGGGRARGYSEPDQGYGRTPPTQRPTGRPQHQPSAAQPQFQPYAAPQGRPQAPHVGHADARVHPHGENGYHDPYVTPPSDPRTYAEPQGYEEPFDLRQPATGRAGRRVEPQWQTAPDQHYEPQQGWPQQPQQQGYADPYGQPAASHHDPYAGPHHDLHAHSQPAGNHGYYDEQGYDQQAYDQQAYAQQGYPPQHGYDQQGYQQQGYDQQGYTDGYGYEDPNDPQAGYPADAGQEGYVAGYEEPQRRGRRGLIVAGALVAAVAIGGGLGFVYKLTSGSAGGSSEPPVLTAEKKSAKKAPADPGGKAFEGTKKSIYEQLGTSKGDTDAQIVTGEEDVVARGSGDDLPGIAITVPADEADGSGTGEGEDAAGLPRKVATVLIKPGETITADSETLAAAPKSAKERKDAVKAAMAEAIAAAGQDEDPFAGSGDLGAEGSGETTATAAAVEKPAKKAKQEVKTAAVEPTAATASEASETATSGGGGYVVQVKSSKSRVDALGSFADLQQKHAALLSGSQPDIREVNLGESKGIWYRLRIGPPSSKSAAYDLCKKLKSAGQDCLVSAY